MLVLLDDDSLSLPPGLLVLLVYVLLNNPLLLGPLLDVKVGLCFTRLTSNIYYIKLL